MEILNTFYVLELYLRKEILEFKITRSNINRNSSMVIYKLGRSTSLIGNNNDSLRASLEIMR